MGHAEASNQWPRCDADLAAKCAAAFTQIIFIKLISDVSSFNFTVPNCFPHSVFFFLRLFRFFFHFFLLILLLLVLLAFVSPK